MTPVMQRQLACFLLLLATHASAQPAASGPLHRHPANPRYFADASGKAVYLTGSHTWNNLPDIGTNQPPTRFDFDAYLGFLQKHHHNFIRLWRWEHASWQTEDSDHPALHFVEPHPWKRTGPGAALDGKPRFDLEKFDEEYFARLHSRVKAAGERGIYVSVMLFEGWALQHMTNAWRTHPFHRENNVNRMDGDLNGDGVGTEVHTLQSSAVRDVQERYVVKTLDTLRDLDNVLYEISNETGSYSTQWQYHMLRFIKEHERTKGRPHPVGMTFQYSRDPKQRGLNQALLESPADWISPNAEAGRFNFQTNPPSDIESHVILNDSDHLWGLGGSVPWVWKSFCRGLNPIFMDPYDHSVLGHGSPAQWDAIRRSLGESRRLAERVDLAAMVPRSELASSRYCLAQPGRSYVVYLAEGDEVTVDLRTDAAEFTVEWIHPVDGTKISGERVRGGASRAFKKPASAGSVLFLQAMSKSKERAGGSDYFPSPESQGGWRKLDTAEDLRAPKAAQSSWGDSILR